MSKNAVILVLGVLVVFLADRVVREENQRSDGSDESGGEGRRRRIDIAPPGGGEREEPTMTKDQKVIRNKGSR
jgi:hypothetical protein